MFYPSTPNTSRRQGVVLLVVVSLLTLFAIVGLSFVMYAESEAKGSQIQREAQVQFRSEIEPDLLAAFALSQLIFDVANDESGLYSAMRGHSLARSMYGWNDSLGAANIVPFNGVGRLRTGAGTPTLPVIQLPGSRQYNNSYNVSDHFLVNYTYFSGDSFIRAPERLGSPVLDAAGQPTGEHTPRTSLTDPRGWGPFTGGYNVPYTYPDLNNMFLAAIQGDGTVLSRSFHRDWTGFGSLSPSNTNWTNLTRPMLKHLVMRPRPADHARDAAGNFLFPMPEDAGGDVKQLVGTPGGNDSFWMDLGFPVRRTPEGVKYKPLFAFFVTDLDNRINLNVHGNVRGVNAAGMPEHRSNMGWGPWEVNINKVLQAPDLVNPGRGEWVNLFRGDTMRSLSGRYGMDRPPFVAQPSANQVALPGTTPHFYGQVDFDAAKRNFLASERFYAPGHPSYPGVGTFLSPFPYFPTEPSPRPGFGWDNGWHDTAIRGFSERSDHPLLYDVMSPRGGDDRRFALSNMEALLRYGDTGTSALTSELFQLSPNYTHVQSLLTARNLVTVRSFDVDRPGVTPWLYQDPNLPPTYPDAEFVGSGTTRAPHAGPVPFPRLAWRSNPPTANPPLGYPPEFGLNDWRWQPVVASAMWRADLNRKLSPYPPPLALGPTYSHRHDYAATQQQFLKAREERHQFANDLYERLLAAVGVPRKIAIPNREPLDEELKVRRWLAQIAVNIVDYIDDDDVNTSFLFYSKEDAYNSPAYDPGKSDSPENPNLPRYWVFGTELPRLVLNEVLVETHRNIYIDGENDQQVRVFAELHNPLVEPPTTSTVTVQQQDAQPVRLRMRMSGQPSFSLPPTPEKVNEYNVFQVEISHGLLGWKEPPAPPPPVWHKNVTGMSDTVKISTNDDDFSTPRPETRVVRITRMPDPVQNVPPDEIMLAPGHFMLLGPREAPEGAGAQEGQDGRRSIWVAPNMVPAQPLWLQSENMQYPTADPDFINERQKGITVSLQRLANPYLPPETAASLESVPGSGVFDTPNPWYNPYIAIDHVDHNPLRHYDPTQNPGIYASRGKQQPYASFLERDPRDSGNPAVRDPLRNSPVMTLPTTGAAADSTVHSFGKPNHKLPNNPGDPPVTPGDPLIPLAGYARPHYHWLAHLDRQLVSPLELVHVCGFAPHELTQRFVTTFDLPGTAVNGVDVDVATQGDTTNGNATLGGPFRIQPGDWVVITDADPDYSNPRWVRVDRMRPGGFQADRTTLPGLRPNGFKVLGQMPYNHRLRWMDENQIAGESQRLYRFFELVTCGSRASGIAAGARVPGKININTIWDRQTVRALVDAQLPNSFYNAGNPDQVADGIHTLLMSANPLARTQGAAPGSNDRPFWGFGFGQHPPADPQYPTGGNGIYNSFLRFTDPSGSAAHPYEVFELPNKVLGNLTTRSNVYAVWVTVGFFEVKDDTTQPPKLGAEIGKSENRHVRHRMFSIVDRTNLSVATGVTQLRQAVAAGGGLRLDSALMVTSGTTPSGFSWDVRTDTTPDRRNSTLIVDVGERQEVVVINRAAVGQPITFTKPHDANAPISLPNVPGEAPWFLKSVTVENAGIAGDPQQFWITLPETVPANATQITGEYDGIQWRIAPNSSWLIVGSGADQEYVQVLAVRRDPSNAAQSQFRVRLTRNHPEPFAIANMILGNPGPQPRFNPRQAPYSAVVRYLSVIQ